MYDEYMNEFRKFNSIKNVDSPGCTDKIIMHGYGNELFVVQEKYHGANFGVICDGETTSYQRREDLLNESDRFFGYTRPTTRDQDKYLEVFKKVKEVDPSVESITIYGELVGGIYSHEDVPRSTSDDVVNAEVHYTPEIDIIWYEIFVRSTDSDYMNIKEGLNILKDSELLFAEILFEGSLQECIEYSSGTNADPSLGHLKWDLPYIPKNIREGNVIKPCEVLYTKDGRRVILKDKNNKFHEKLRKIANTNVPESDDTSKELIKSYITENRLRNVLSKHSRFDKNSFGKLMGLFMKDVIQDFREDHPGILTDLSKKDRKNLTNYATDVAKRLIMSYFAKITEGTF